MAGCRQRSQNGLWRPALAVVIVTGCACAAEVCPPGNPFLSGGPAETLQWQSYRGQLPGKKYCIANDVRAVSIPISVIWTGAGIRQATVQELRVAQCCFDAVGQGKASIRYGSTPKDIDLSMYRPAEEGLAEHEEGFPDLIEGDARVRVVSIRGTVIAASRPLRIDVQLKCSASQFAKQYAYQYAITDRSPDPVEVEWDLLQAMSADARPSVQTAAGTKTYIFISGKTPREAVGTVAIRVRGGGVPAAIFQLDGFAASGKLH